MRIALAILVISTAVFCAACERIDEVGTYGLCVNSYNRRIESAIGEGANWPNYPGGLSGMLFGLRAMVLPRESPRPRSRNQPAVTHIVFPAPDAEQSAVRPWLEAMVMENTDGSWRVVSVVRCGAEKAAAAEAKLKERRRRSVSMSGLDYVTQGPLDFLEVLKARKRPVWLGLIPTGWVSESDLPALFALLDSEEPCAGVISMLSSRIDTTHSTVGNQVAYMIEGFRRSSYPPSLLTTTPYENVDELKQWWCERGGT